MRLALKNTLLLLTLYVVGVGALAWWMVGQLNVLAEGVAESSARLVGGEVAHALRDSALDQLQRADDTTRARLEQIVEGLTEHSSILTSLAVVDRGGTVIAGDNVEIGRQLALPEIVFAGGAPRVRVMRPPGTFDAGTYFVMVPLMQGQDMAGYVRLTMRSERIAQLYARGLRHLAAVAAVGLLAVGATGLLLHVQLSRRGAALSRALAAAVRGEAPPSGRYDEFASSLEVARQVGRELNEARGGRMQALQRMDALLQALDVGVLMLEREGALGFANQRAAELLGYADPAALAAAWDAELRPAMARQRRREADGADPATDAMDERLAPLQLEFVPLGGGEGEVVLVRSAESLDALQRELGLAMQMRGLMRFYAAFAHDLKAPLNAMVMTLELLKLTVQGAGDSPAAAKQVKYVGTLNEEIQRLDRQLRTLLTHTAPPSEVRRELDLRNLLRELEALLAPQARRQKVELSVQVPEDPVTLVGWGDRLKQAMLNVVVNALEAMPDGGTLTMALERCNGEARVAVHDTGPGIPPELLDTIYQMHFTTKNGGSGVGLYVARSVVEAHGGSIEVRSAAGEGTSFVLTLPLTTGPL